MEEKLSGGGGNSNDDPNAQNEESTKSREEGELSSDDDVEGYDEAGSAPDSTGCNAAQVGSCQPTLANEGTRDIEAGKCIPPDKSAFMVDASSKSYLQLDNHKSSDKNRVPFLISFSDEETGGDSDDSRHNTLASQEHTLGADRSRILPISSLPKSENLPKNTVIETRDVSLGRPFVSAIVKSNGITSRKGGQTSSLRNLHNIKKGAAKDHGHKTNVHLNSIKLQLQDLRQLIAVRESQLKFKSTPQTKTNVYIRNPSNSVKRVRRAASGNDLRRDLKEPHKKRLNTGEHQPSQLGLDFHKDTHSVEQILTSGKSVLENCGKQGVNNCNHCSKRPRRGTSQSSHVQKNQDAIECAFSLADRLVIRKEDQNIVASSITSDKNAKLPGLAISSDETVPREKRAAADDLRQSAKMELTRVLQDVQMSIQDKFSSGNSVIERSNLGQVKASEGAIIVNSDNRNQTSAFNTLHNNRQAPANNPSFLNGLDKLSLLGSNNVDMQSLLDVEELLDKELEEAQEHRHKCEIEERNAFIAYRKAQRALTEANARCSHLYSKRESYSTQLRSLMLENPNLFFSSRLHDQNEPALKYSNNTSDANLLPIPTSSHYVQSAFNVYNRQGCDSNIPTVNDALQTLSNLQVDAQNLVSDPCGEPDCSSSEAHKQDGALNGVCCPSDDLSQSADQDNEILQFECKTAQDEFESKRTSDFEGRREKDINEGPRRQVSFESSQDSLLLEASLRSQLFEKLKTKKLLKRGTSQTMELVAERASENNDGGNMMGTETENASLCEAENGKQSSFEVVDKEERSLELPAQISSHFESSRSEHASPSMGDPVDSYFSLEGRQSTISSTFFCPIVRTAFIHLKVAEPIGVLQPQTTSSDIVTSDVDEENANHNVHSESKEIRPTFNTIETAASALFVRQSGFYGCNLSIDSFKPLCMYELRGKCNNDECSWQHVKDYSYNNMKHDTIDNSDCHVGKQAQREEFCTAGVMSKSLDNLLLAPPTYVVCSDVLKPDSQSYTSVLAQGYGQCWQKCFSYFLVLSSMCPTVPLSNEPFLHGTEARVEVHSCWNRQSSYFQCRNGTESQVDQCSVGADESLEIALLNFYQEANKYKDRLEALKALARAIESNPRSAVVWIVYLLIYYSNQKSIGKDDLFQYAVENNEESYELWILYINSRVQLDDRLAAYDAALSSLSRRASVSDGDALYVSQYILDIFLQMMDCLCMSGNDGRAIEKISVLLSPTKGSDACYLLSLHDVVSYLTICDKFIFWVCCVYLVVYKKLPNLMVHSFECWKESLVFVWPDCHLTLEEKQKATSLMEMAVDSLALYMDCESLDKDKTLRAAHLFALNHVRCVLVLEGLECSRNLLEKYIDLYPSCLELVLTSARAEYHMGGLSFHGFDEALRNWPEEVPGIQCIWNQYAECAFQSENYDFVRDLMDRWFHSVFVAHYSHYGSLRTKDNSGSSGFQQSASVSDLCAWFSNDNQNDMVFAMLNFSLYKILQNDHTEARCALDWALKVASADNFHHSLRELALFLLTDSVQHCGDAWVKHMVNTLKVHLIDAQALLSTEPLSRGFIQKIKKPLVRQLVSKLLRPVSADFCLMNMILEIFYGLSLLPNVFDKVTDLVDFVEGMMEILPSNYLLAVSVCKLLTKRSNSGNVSPSVSFWASSLLVNALFHAVPVAPEYVWVEAADVLHNLADIQTIWESFHKKALSVYPFSINLWKSCLRLSETAGNGTSIKAAALGKGIELD